MKPGRVTLQAPLEGWLEGLPFKPPMKGGFKGPSKGWGGGRRLYGRSESRNYAAGKRGGVCSIAEKWIFVDKKSEETKHPTEWCAEAGRCTGPKFLSKSLENGRRRHLGGHDLVRRMDRQGEVLIWCRKCSEHARQRVEPKLMDCCRPEQVGTKESGNWRIEGEKKRITRKEYQRLLNKFLTWKV